MADDNKRASVFESLQEHAVAPGRGEFEPREQLPVVSVVHLPPVAAEDYQYGIDVLEMDSRLPVGLELLLVVSRKERSMTFGIWETLEAGREFFAKMVAARAPQLARSTRNTDIIRREYRLANLLPGERADKLALDTQPDIGSLVADILTVRFPIDERAGRTMREAYRRLTALDQTEDFVRERREGLLLEFSAVIDGGIQIVCVHDDPRRSTEFIERIAIRQGLEAFSDWPKPEVETERFGVVRCSIQESLLDRR